MNAEPLNDPWDEFLDQASAYANSKQQSFREQFGQHDRFDCDLEAGTLVFSSGGAPRVRADILVAGSFAESTNTWLWSWANSQFPEIVSGRVSLVREHGQAMGFEYLTDRKPQSTLEDSWWLAGCACYILEADGVYRAPNKGVHTFLLLFSPEHC